MTAPAPDPTTRAAAALGVPPDADPAAVREAFLRKLADADYAPPEGWVAGVNRLGGTAIPLSCEAVASEADAVRDEIDAFAAGFWGMDPDARRAKWNDLHARCPAGPSAAFLNQLELGLGVAAVPHPDEGVEAVASLARELFVLRPRPRAVRRAEWLANHDATDSQKAVAERLAVDQPGVAALDPILFGRLTGKIGRGEAVGGDSTRGEDEDEALANFRRSTDSFRQRLANSQQHAKTQPEASHRTRPDDQPSQWGASSVRNLAIVVGVLLAFARMIAHFASSSTPQNTYSPPPMRYPPPSTEPFRRWQPDPPRKYTPEQVMEYLKYRPGSKDPAPPGYYIWVDEQPPNIRDMIFRSVPTRR